MAKNLGTIHGVGGSYVSDVGSLTELQQIAKTDNDADNGVIATDSNDLKSILGNVTTNIHSLQSQPAGSLSAEDRETLTRLRRIQSQIEDLVSKVEADAAVTEVRVTAGTANFVDWGTSGQRYKSSNITITGSGNTRSISGVDPVSDGFFAASGSTESVAANTTLLWARDTQGTEFEFVRKNASNQLQFNNYLSAVTNTDTASHHTQFARRPGRTNDVLSGNTTSLGWNFPTITGTLRDDSIFRLNFQMTLNVNGQTRAFPIEVSRAHHPAGANSARNWDDTTVNDPLEPGADANGWVERSGILWANQEIILEWRITEISSQKVFEWRVQDGGRLPAGVSVTFGRNDITYFLTNGRAATDQWFTVETTVGNDWAGTSDDYDFMFQVHPSNPAVPNSFSVIVPVVRDENGTETQFDDITMSNQNPVQAISQFRTDIAPKFMTNNLATNLTHASLEEHLRDYDLEYCWGYARNRTLGTETRVTGDLDVIGGKIKIDGTEISTGGGDSFPSAFETETGASVTMDASHIGKIVVMSNSSAKTYNINNSLGNDGDIIMFQNSGAGVLTIVNPLTTVDDIVVASDSSVVIRKFTQSGFSYWYHTAVARPTDASGGGGGGYAAPDLPSTSVNRTNITDVTVPSSWVGNINVFTGDITSNIIVTVNDSIGSDGDFITFRSSTNALARGSKIIRSGRTGNPQFGVLMSTGDLVLHKVEGRWYLYSNVGAATAPGLPFVLNTSTASRTISLSEHGAIAASNTTSNVTWTLPSTAPVGWWCIALKDGDDNGRLRVQAPTNHNLVGRGDVDFVVDATQDYVDLEYVNDMMIFLRVNQTGNVGQTGWWSVIPLRYKPFEQPATRRAVTLSTATTTAISAYVRRFNAITSSVANRTITLPTTIGQNGDTIVIGNAGTQNIRVNASQWDGTGNTNYTLEPNEGMTFRKGSGRWYKS